MLPDLLHAWRDFFIVAATAGATLIGAMFVVVSIATGILTPERSRAAHAYLTSTLVHMGAVVVAGLLTMVPPVNWIILGVVLLAGGLIGIGYEITLAEAVRRFKLDWTDLLWYTAIPLIGYTALAASGALCLVTSPHAIDVLAASLVLLLLVGIHNAWDMILIFATRPRPQPIGTDKN